MTSTSRLRCKDKMAAILRSSNMTTMISLMIKATATPPSKTADTMIMDTI
jgi:hypothetical protein